MPVKISQNENHPLSQRLHKLNIHANIFILYVLPFCVWVSPLRNMLRKPTRMKERDGGRERLMHREKEAKMVNCVCLPYYMLIFVCNSSLRKNSTAKRSKENGLAHKFHGYFSYSAGFIFP